ncbi:MAG: TRAP transporter small permease subunit [Hyphomicrobiales bacterium]|nr:TRAP transporter small permease subunit [Hyphomicrobiales bacterium]MCP4999320.1 TRAP transporter small permease subunit [Hyphomicrobiales bacterium]
MTNVFAKFCTIHDRLTEVAAVLGAIGLIGIVVSYVYEVVTRYFFNAPTAWVSDFVSYALCASVFLALPKVTKDKGHVAVTIVVDIVPQKIADTMHTTINLIGFICLGFAAYISLQENIRQYSKGIETLAIVPIPQWWVSSFITFGLALSSIYFLRYAPASQRVRSDVLKERPG